MFGAMASQTRFVGQAIARYSLVFFFLAFGGLKFTAGEAAAIHPLLVHSPFLGWLPTIADPRTSSAVIGVIEIGLALLVASRPFLPRASAVGSAGMALSLVVTLSFLVTTPHIDPALQSFIVKDLTLLGVAIWSAGEALAGRGRRVSLVQPDSAPGSPSAA